MKKFKILRLLSIVTIAAAGVFGAVNFKSSKKVETRPVEAASTMVSGTRVYIEDQTGSAWTASGKDAIMHVYNVSFVSGSGYSSLSDIKQNDLYATSFATDGSTYINIRMKWTGGSYRQYEAILPWYIQSFKTEFYATHDGNDKYLVWNGSETKINYTCSRGTARRVYITYVHGWGSGSNHTVYVSTSDATDNNYTYEFNGIKSGSHMYLNTTDLTDWEQSNAKFGICFGKSNVNKADGWSSQYNTAHTSLSQTFCWKVQGSGDSHLYECIVPQYNGQDVYWSMVIGVRFNSSATSLGWSNVWNQTGDQFYNGDDGDCNMLWVNAASGGAWSGGGYIRSDKTISDDTRAGYYGTYFLNQITCSGSGSITSSSSNWTNVKNEYKQHLSTAVEGKVWTAVGASTGSDLVKAMYRYDYIVFHKCYSGYDDFINRATSSGKSFSNPNVMSLLFAKNINTSLILVVIISVVGVAVIGGYFFYKKRKENY